MPLVAKNKNLLATGYSHPTRHSKPKTHESWLQLKIQLSIFHKLYIIWKKPWWASCPLDTKFAVHINVDMDTWLIMSNSCSYVQCDTKLMAKTRLFHDASPHWMQQPQARHQMKALGKLVHLMPHFHAMSKCSWIHRRGIVEFSGLESDFAQKSRQTDVLNRRWSSSVWHARDSNHSWLKCVVNYSRELQSWIMNRELRVVNVELIHRRMTDWRSVSFERFFCEARVIATLIVTKFDYTCYDVWIRYYCCGHVTI